MKNETTYSVKKMKQYTPAVFENGKATGETCIRVYVCVERKTLGLGGLKDQYSYGGFSLNRDITLEQAKELLTEGQDLTGQVIFIGDPGIQEDGRPGYYTAQLV